MKLTNEQIQAILDGAPEGATHYTSAVYLRYDSKSWVWWSEVEDGWCFVRDESLGWAQLLGGYHGSLSDLREILELRQEVASKAAEVERLRAQQSEVAARAVESFIDNELRSACLSAGWDTESSAYQVSLMLEHYANKLREQSE